MIHEFFFTCTIYQTDEKLTQVNEQLSRQKISERLSKHPKSAWWINNSRLADFCRISHAEKAHNTTILGKYLPRGEQFWQRSKGLHHK